MTTYYLVQGDDAPQIKVTLTRDVTGTAIDVSNATVRLKFRKKGTDTVLVTLTSGASASQAENGIAIFDWGSTDLDIDSGNYEAEVEISYTSTGVVETVYETLDFVVREDF